MGQGISKAGTGTCKQRNEIGTIEMKLDQLKQIVRKAISIKLCREKKIKGVLTPF